MFARDGDSGLQHGSARSRNIHGSPRAASRPAFSLAELMIALAVLGMGLLVIAAALPAGVKYTKQTVDQTTAAAATDYAFELIEQNLALRDRVLDKATATVFTHAPTLFQPRYPESFTGGDVLGADGRAGKDQLPDMGRPAWSPNIGDSRPYEPIVKVRSLHLANIQARLGTSWSLPYGDPLSYGDLFPTYDSFTEDAIYRWLNDYSLRVGFGISVDKKECDAGPLIDSGFIAWLRPGMSPKAVTYPPPLVAGSTQDFPQLPEQYLLSMGGDPYSPTPVMRPNRSPRGAETTEALKQRTVWTAFYRRVSYAADADPTLYEFIVVVCRRPTEKHWFPVQDPDVLSSDSDLSDGFSILDIGALSPVPWLITFDQNGLGMNSLPVLRFDGGLPEYTIDEVTGERLLKSNYQSPATLTFLATESAGRLLPKGSIFIPALNDRRPHAYPAGVDQISGLVPSAPDALPIYRVIDRVERRVGATVQYEIIVEDNGLYPWVEPSVSSPAALWPVWVIPPAVDGVDSDGVPQFSDQSPVLSVERRYVRLRELP